jgi:ankyrin repeat protein
MIASGDMGEANLPIMRALLDAGARVDLVGADGYTALCRAAGAEKRARQAVELLLARGADPGQRAMFTPLFCAVEAGNADVVDLLLRRRVDVDAPIWTGKTALMEARTAPIWTRLLRRGADVARRDRDRRTALHHAVEGARTALVDALLRRGADPSARDRAGVTPLHLAAGLDDDVGATITARLLRAGARVEVRDREQLSPLLRACELDRIDVAIALLDAGARPGVRALRIAAENGYADLGQELLARGARRDPAALALAHEHQRDEFVRLLGGEVVPAETLPRAVRALSERAEALYARGRYRDALARYRRVPAGYRDRIYANVSNMGYCYQQLGRPREAAACFERAIVLKPDAALHLFKGLCYAHYVKKRWEEMERCARRAVELGPKDDYAWQQLAIALVMRGDLPGAVDAGKRAVALNPGNTNARINLEQARDALTKARG